MEDGKKVAETGRGQGRKENSWRKRRKRRRPTRGEKITQFNPRAAYIGGR